MDQPESLRLRSFLRPFISIILFITLAYVATNAMPFFADGTRMGLADGIKAIALSGARPTVPFAAAGPQNTTAISTAILPADLNPLTRYISSVGRPFGFDVLTSLALIALIVMGAYEIIFKGLRIPFVVAYNGARKKAWNTRIPTKSLVPIMKGRLLVPVLIVFAVLIGAWTLGHALVFSLEGVGMDDPTSDGLPPYSGLAISAVIALVISGGYWKWAVGKIRSLAGRRCKQCNAMDSFRWIDHEELGRQHMVQTTTKTWEDGHKTTSSSNYTDIKERNTKRCTSCGYTVNVYGTRQVSGHK